jgi:hypothetical protein
MKLLLTQHVGSFFFFITNYATVSFEGMSAPWKQLSSSYYDLEAPKKFEV